MNRRLGTAILAVWVLLAVGCGARADVTGTEGRDLGAVAAGQDAPGPAPSVPAATTENVEAGRTPAAAQGSEPSDTTQPPRDPGTVEPEASGEAADRGHDGPDVPIDITVTPTCVAVGEPVAAHISTVPDAELTLAVGYSDGQPHGQMGFARADDDGSHVWRWVVAPDVPPGEATVLVMSVTPEGDAADTERAPFTVASSGGCP